MKKCEDCTHWEYFTNDLGGGNESPEWLGCNVQDAKPIEECEPGFCEDYEKNTYPYCESCKNCKDSHCIPHDADIKNRPSRCEDYKRSQ